MFSSILFLTHRILPLWQSLKCAFPSCGRIVRNKMSIQRTYQYLLRLDMLLKRTELDVLPAQFLRDRFWRWFFYVNWWGVNQDYSQKDAPYPPLSLLSPHPPSSFLLIKFSLIKKYLIFTSAFAFPGFLVTDNCTSQLHWFLCFHAYIYINIYMYWSPSFVISSSILYISFGTNYRDALPLQD